MDSTSAVAKGGGQGGVHSYTPLVSHFGLLKILLLEQHHVTTTQQTMVEKEIITFKHDSSSMCFRLFVNCNCNYISFTKLPWPGDSKRTFRSSSQAATCSPVYHKRRRLHTVPLIAERQAGKLWIPIFIVFGMTRLGNETESTVSVADALSTRPLIG